MIALVSSGVRNRSLVASIQAASRQSRWIGSVETFRGVFIFEANVKEHAPLSVGAHVDRGVDVITTEDHENRAADRGCVSRLVRFGIFVGI